MGGSAFKWLAWSLLLSGMIFSLAILTHKTLALLSRLHKKYAVLVAAFSIVGAAPAVSSAKTAPSISDRYRFILAILAFIVAAPAMSEILSTPLVTDWTYTMDSWFIPSLQQRAASNNCSFSTTP